MLVPRVAFVLCFDLLFWEGSVKEVTGGDKDMVVNGHRHVGLVAVEVLEGGASQFEDYVVVSFGSREQHETDYSESARAGVCKQSRRDARRGPRWEEEMKARGWGLVLQFAQNRATMSGESVAGSPVGDISLYILCFWYESVEEQNR